MTKEITAKDIHADFYGAEERLYVEAIGLSQGSLVTKKDKAERLKKIGFGKAKPIKDQEAFNEKRKISGHMIKVIEYFRTYYPSHKFITEDEVKRLCEKYGLLLGDADNYIGDMPEKNLQDVEKFKLRKEDWKEKEQNLYRWFVPALQSPIDEFGSWEGFLSTGIRRSRRSSSHDMYMSQLLALMTNPTSSGDQQKKEKEVEKEQPPFKICAPKTDFYMRGYEVRDGYKIVYDPIVLQPVSKEGIDGYLIVTAWGDEASDEIVVNQANN